MRKIISAVVLTAMLAGCSSISRYSTIDDTNQEYVSNERGNIKTSTFRYSQRQKIEVISKNGKIRAEYYVDVFTGKLMEFRINGKTQTDKTILEGAQRNLDEYYNSQEQEILDGSRLVKPKKSFLEKIFDNFDWLN